MVERRNALDRLACDAGVACTTQPAMLGEMFTMNNLMNPARPSLPNGLVPVKKGTRGVVLVGVTGSNRIPTIGFDVKDQSPSHWRPVPHGPFGVFIAARQAVEVKVMLDGKVLAETKLFPAQPPSGVGIDPKMLKLMAEAPQPHFVSTDPEGNPLMFAPHPGGLGDDLIIAEQLHPGSTGQPAPTLADVDGHNAAVHEEMKLDIDPSTLNVPWLHAPAAPTDQTIGDVATGQAGDQLADADKSRLPPGDSNWDLAELLGPEMTAALAEATTDADATRPELDDEPLVPHTLDVTRRPLSWAPSHGLVAVGIRLLQTVQANEPPTPPDSYTYVVFQMNPMSLHVRALNRLLNKRIIPSKNVLRDLMVAGGFEQDAPPVQHIACADVHCRQRHGRS
jgi:hypothetical protein